MLYGRRTEQERIAALVAAARDRRRSGALVLRGEAGIGKSALLDGAAALLPQDGTGARVLRVVGIEAETGIAFAGLNQLLWPVRDRVDALPAPQASPLCIALGRESPASGGTDPVQDRFTIGLAVLTLLADIADQDGPVLCLVDDAHWLDTATQETLLFAARRLGAEGVVMLFATRDEAFTGTGLPELVVGRLERDDAERVLADRRLSPSARERVLLESAGNPLALLEFAATGDEAPDGPHPLPVTDRVIASFQSRIGGLTDSARLMLLVAAAEGRGHMPSMLAAAGALGVGLDDLAEAERARLVEVTGRTVAFRHPLIRAAAYQGAPAARRLTVHRALADAADDPGCRARHRAAAALAPDEDVAADVAAAAGRARDRAAYGSAAALYRQAAELSPDPAARASRFGAAAAASLRAGRPDQAGDLAARAAKLTADPAGHARLGRVLAAVEYERGDPRLAARMLVEHASRAAAADRPAMLRAAAGYAWTAGEAPALHRAAALLPGEEALRGLALLADGDHAQGLPLLAGVVAEARAGALGAAGSAGGLGQADDGDGVEAARLALILGDDEAALDLAAIEVARLRGQGLIGALPAALRTLAQAQLAAGLHTDAESTASEAVALARDTGLPDAEGRFGAVLARAAAIEGDEVRLRELAIMAPVPDARPLAAARGLLHLGLGRHDDALRGLDTDRRPRRSGADDMLSAADLVEAAVRAGRPERARAAYEELSAWAETSKQPWALAVALRCEALLDDAEEPFVQAVRLHDRSTRPFERARTELLYGEWLRRTRRRSDARAPLRSAAEIFERLRAAPWLDRALAELRATGEAGTASAPAAPDLLDRLTSQELQVVRLAAEGTSSRDIAAQLFLSPRTVEYHLYKAYPKLGISSRKELSRLIPEPATSGAPQWTPP
ncbi:LuxR family transcriptional regulator [Actinomadura sp. WMMA1423]|uniref:helix-turn-helix transcriptional regulator n=1 Tax=Actinomadura sp. WMMA1423 TaxID=2591108 RepID=UPI001146B54B|nr:LuxR family transcriptional regulator [Actinomadura sp. WMMA1423]